MADNHHRDRQTTLEDVERQQMAPAPEEDQGVNYDDELDEKRVLDETLRDDDPRLPSERRRPRATDPPPPIPQPPGDGLPTDVTGRDEDEDFDEASS